MSTARVIWIVWCLFWVAFWLIFGWFVPGLNLLLAGASGFAVLAPVGKARVKQISSGSAVPSSVFDPRFSDEDKRAYFGKHD